MESIERLREWVDNNCCLDNAEVINDRLDAIEQEVDEMWHALTIDAKPMTDENMAESGWVRLPVDADGEPIHIGDVMENIVCPPVHREVTGVGVECFYGWDDGNGRYSQFDVACYRHHHAPTVEDVLREFAHVGIHIAAKHGIKAGEIDFYADEDAIAEYAAKLRLASNEE